MRGMTTVAVGLALITLRAEAVPDACDEGFGSLSDNALATAADAVIDGRNRFEATGAAVANIGDFDGDGVDDLAVGIPGDNSNGARAGGVDLYLSEGGAPAFGTPSVRIYGTGAADNAGASVAAAGDVNGDGYDDLIIGSAPTTRSAVRTGAAWILYGTPSASTTYSLRTQAGATLLGPNFGDEFGARVAGVGDVNGDGYDDVAVGAPGADSNGVDAGAAFVFYGPLSGSRAAATADRVHSGAAAGDRAGQSIAGLGDVDGDGSADYAIGAPAAGPALATDGAVYLVTATTPGVTSLSTAAATLTGGGNERLGYSLAAAGDTNDDGVSELWTGSRTWGSSKRGSVSLVDVADTVGAQALAAVELAHVRGRNASDYFGTSLAGGVDFDADGELDVIVGADAAEGVYTSSGAAWTLHGPFAGETIATSAAGVHAGGGSGVLTGASVAAFPDLNDDGYADVVIGSPGANPAGKSGAGGASVFYGGADLADATTYYLDADHDTWGGATTTSACSAPSGYVARGGDCNDASVAWHPYAQETSCADPNDYSCDGSTGAADVDGDGVTACQNDCADNDANVGAGKPEHCANDIDDDCNGAIDDSLAVEAQVWRPDADHDGYGNAAIGFTACSAPAFFLEPPVTVSGDCDDAVAAVHPGAVESCDGEDNDCSGVVDGEDAVDALDWYPDADADGFGLRAWRARACEQPEGYAQAAGDCDDDDAGVAPGGVEVCDFADNDCDGELYLGGRISAFEATWRLQGAVAPERFGAALAAVPDMDGDSYDELAVSAPDAAGGGAVYIVSESPTSGSLAVLRPLAGGQLTVRATIRAEYARGGFGDRLAAGDFDGDGVGDLAIAAPVAATAAVSQGAVYVFYGPLSGDLSAANADGKVTGLDGNDRLGTALVAGDLNNDGRDELLIGAPGADLGGDRLGAVLVATGDPTRATLTGAHTITDFLRIGGAATRDELGQSVAILGDTDGDGMKEFAGGATLGGASDTGYVYVQSWSGLFNQDPPVAQITGAGVAQRLGRALAGGDVTGDGYADLVVANALSRVWLVPGSATGLGSGTVAALATSELRGPTGADLGAVLAVVPDADADGVDDLLLSAPSDDELGADAGAVYLLYGSDALPGQINVEQIESFGRVDKGSTFPTYSASNYGYAEGAKLQGGLANGQLGVAVLTGFHSRNAGLGDIVLGGANADSRSGYVVGWATGPYGWDVGSTAEIEATQEDFWPDVDLDGQGDEDASSERMCRMHAPISFVHPFDPVLAVVSDEALVTDCDDLDPRTYLGAAEVPGDGIDQDCNGEDLAGGNSAPTVTDCHIEKMSILPIAWGGGGGPTPSTTLVTGTTAQAFSTATDPEGDAVTVSYVWRDGSGAVIGTGSFLGGAVITRGATLSLSCTPSDGLLTGGTIDAVDVVVGNAPPVGDTVDFTPSSPTSAESISASPNGTDAEGDTVTWTCAWTANGVDLGVTGATLDASYTARNDAIGASCTPNDGYDDGSPATGAVGVGNSPPIASAVNLTSDGAFRTDAWLSCEASGDDDDGDSISWVYGWWANGIPVASSTPINAGALVRKGDVVTCGASGWDGIAYGPLLMSAPVTIVNAPPVVMGASVYADVSPASEASTLTCNHWLAYDTDVGDPVNLSYVWRVNGSAVGTGSTLSSASFQKNDSVTCTITPDDGIVSGAPDTATPVIISNAAPTVSSVTVVSSMGTVNESATLTCTPVGADLDSDTLSWSYNWVVNGNSISTAATLTGASFNKGDVISCGAAAHDGTAASSTVYSTDVTAVNAAPSVSGVAISSSSTPVREASTLTCTYTSASDPDGDSVTVDYGWTVNGAAVSTASTLTGALFNKGDSVVCTVTPDDGTTSGTAGASSVVTPVNTPPTTPVVVVSPEVADTQDDVRCLIATPATDPDPADTIDYLIAWDLDGSDWTDFASTTSWTDDTIEAANLLEGTYTCEVLAFDTDSDLSDVASDANPVFEYYDRQKVRVGVSSTHVCAILDDNSLKCWGGNASGQLGQGSTTTLGDGAGEMGDSLAAIDLPGTWGVEMVSLGISHTCALLENGQVYCWGLNTNGELGRAAGGAYGDGAGEMGDNLVAVPLTGNVAQLDSGDTFTCVRKTTGEVQCWGASGSGQLGQGNTTASATPVSIDFGTGRTATWIGLGGSHACAILDNNTIKCWGANSFGQLGRGDTAVRGDGANEMGNNLTATDVGTGTPIMVDGGAQHSCVQFSNNTIKCWGGNSIGQLGKGNTTQLGDGAGEMGAALTTINVSSTKTINRLFVGSSSNCVRFTDGTAKCWGNGDSNRLGYTGVATNLGDGANEMGDLLPLLSIPNAGKAWNMEIGLGVGCMATECGVTHCWGRNSSGQVGIGSTTTQLGLSSALSLGTGRFIDVNSGSTCLAPYSHTITIDGDPSDWYAAEKFATTQGGATDTRVTWDADYIYIGTTNPDVSAGGAAHWFVSYFGNGSLAGHRDGITYNTQEPYLAAPSQTAARYNADYSFDSALNALSIAGINYWSGTSYYFSTHVAGGQLAENNTNDFMEFRILRSELYLSTVLVVEAMWVYEGAGFETSYSATPSTAFTNGTYDPNFASYLRFDLTHPSGPAVAEVRAALP